MTNNALGRILRTGVIILVGLTAAFNVMGGVGTSCAAFLTKNFPPMWVLFDYQWLYQTFVVTTTLVGLAGIWTTIKLVRGGEHVVRNTLIVLGAAILITGINVAVSLSLRGKAAPADVRLYFNIFTMAAVLASRLPALRKLIDFSRPVPPKDRLTSAGLAAIVIGVGVLTVDLWAGASHMYMGENWINVLRVPLLLTGAGSVLGGMAAILSAISVQSGEAASESMM
jgi:hypothetical protein